MAALRAERDGPDLLPSAGAIRKPPRPTARLDARRKHDDRRSSARRIGERRAEKVRPQRGRRLAIAETADSGLKRRLIIQA